MRGGWARHAIERYELLKKWKELASIVAEACKSVLGPDCLEVYVVGGAAEGRLTVLSDIDVVVVAARGVKDRLMAAVKIKSVALDMGLHEEAPIDLKIMTPEEFKEAKDRYYRKVIKLL